jgi:hypothetical protein
MKDHPSTSGGRLYADGPRPERPWQLRIGFWLFLAIAAFYLLTEHRAHLALGLPYLPFLILAACPLIHLFGHGGHRAHHGHSQQRPPDANTTPPPTEYKSDVPHQHGGDLP